MKKLLLLLFVLSGTTMQAQDSDYISDFKKKWKNAGEYTIEFAEAMPEELYDFKPTEESRIFKDQLLHIVANMTWLSSDYLGGGTFDKDLKLSLIHI